MWFQEKINGVVGYLYLALVLCLSAVPAQAQSGEWELKKNSSGIRIYAQSRPGSDIKALKAEFELQGNVAQLARFLSDISRQKDWVYSTVSSRLVRRTGDHSLIYYSEKHMPWPLSNRDVVIEMKWALDTVAGTLEVHARSIGGHVSEKKGIVRVPSSTVSWKVQTVGPNMLGVEYLAQADPGGTIPAWVINMFLTKGPYETFVKLREQLAVAP
jgi:hypothetical protein